MKTTHIPAEHTSFELKTLILAMSRMSARPFIVLERTMTELDPIETDQVNFHYTDKEGFSFGPGGQGTAAGTETHNKEHYEKVFLNYFAEKVKELDQKEQFDRIIVLVPHELKNEVHDKLDKRITEKTKIIPGNHHNSEPLEILEKIERS